MGDKRSRAVLVGLSAAAGAFAAAAIMSAATAPTARADDYSTILADIEATEADAATAFTNASADFASNDPSGGLTQLFIGLDDDVVGVPDELEVGLTDASTDSTLFPATSFDFTFANPETLTAATTEAQGFYTEGSNLATTIASLPATDYGTIALDNALSTADQWILPGQIELIGALASLGF